MPKATTSRVSTPKPPVRRYVPLTKRVKNPAGRLDWLAMALLEKSVELRRDPVLSEVYVHLRPLIERQAARVLGPQNPHMRKTRRLFLEVIESSRARGVTA